MYVITYILEDSIFSYVNHFKFRLKLSKFWSLFLIILQALFHNSVHFIRTFFWSGRQRVAFLDLT